MDPLIPLATQLHILNLFGGDETPYESLHAVVSCGVKPWFDAFVGTRGGGKDGDSKMGTWTRSEKSTKKTSLKLFVVCSGIPMTKKKFAELELSLLHLQQNVEIPETHLIIHPVIQRAVEQVRSIFPTRPKMPPLTAILFLHCRLKHQVKDRTFHTSHRDF